MRSSQATTKSKTRNGMIRQAILSYSASTSETSARGITVSTSLSSDRCMRARPDDVLRSAQADRVEPIDSLGGAAKQRGLLARTGAARQPLARVPEHLVAVRHFVDREIALEHAPGCAKHLDTRLDIGTTLCGHDVGRWRLRALRESERRVAHS